MSPARPYINAICGIGLLTAMDTVVKELMLGLPFVQAVFLRFAGGSLVALIVLAVTRPAAPTRSSLFANLLRVPLVVLTSGTFFLSIKLLPLAEAFAIAFLAPVFVALFGIVLLRERLDRRIIMALGFGLAGMGIILAPRLDVGSRGASAMLDLSGTSLGVIAALAAAVFYALNLILLRRIAQSEHPSIIVSFQNAGPALVLAIPAALAWQPVSLRQLGLCLVSGLLAVSGHVLLTRAFAVATAARVATTEYTGLIWASALGYALFGEMPGLTTYLGALLIIGGAVLASRR
jgi:drug/metabolite transporter (DMT)-like permease